MMKLSSFLMIVVMLTFSGGLRASDSTSDELKDYQSLRQALNVYTKAIETSDYKLVSSVSHDLTVNFGDILGETIAGFSTGEKDAIGYQQFVNSRPITIVESGENVMSNIRYMRIDGDIANAHVEFANHYCTSITNYLGLVRSADSWKIASIMVWVRPSPEDADRSKFPKGYCSDEMPEG